MEEAQEDEDDPKKLEDVDELEDNELGVLDTELLLLVVLLLFVVRVGVWQSRGIVLPVDCAFIGEYRKDREFLSCRALASCCCCCCSTGLWVLKGMPDLWLVAWNWAKCWLFWNMLRMLACPRRPLAAADVGSGEQQWELELFDERLMEVPRLASFCFLAMQFSLPEPLANRFLPAELPSLTSPAVTALLTRLGIFPAFPIKQSMEKFEFCCFFLCLASLGDEACTGLATLISLPTDPVELELDRSELEPLCSGIFTEIIEDVLLYWPADIRNI